jgi:hypothetical protein
MIDIREVDYPQGGLLDKEWSKVSTDTRPESWHALELTYPDGDVRRVFLARGWSDLQVAPTGVGDSTIVVLNGWAYVLLPSKEILPVPCAGPSFERFMLCPRGAILTYSICVAVITTEGTILYDGSVAHDDFEVISAHEHAMYCTGIHKVRYQEETWEIKFDDIPEFKNPERF